MELRSEQKIEEAKQKELDQNIIKMRHLENELVVQKNWNNDINRRMTMH